MSELSNAPARILVVDDTPRNLKMLADILEADGYAVSKAASGEQALSEIEREPPDLVLLDVLMPGLDGYEVCRRLRARPGTELLPIVMVTGLDPRTERVKGIEAGADDFLSKPIQKLELMARVRSLLRIKKLQDTVQRQTDQLAEWNRRLEQRVREQREELDRKGRLKRFFAPQLVEMLLAGDGTDPLRPHRRKVSVLFLGLRGFVVFAEQEEPEDVTDTVREYHATMGRLILDHGATLDRFTADSMMVFLNDPVEVPDPEKRAIRLAVALRDAAQGLRSRWERKGLLLLGVSIGIASGYATIGKIGFERRWDYAAIGTVSNLAARLCARAESGEILVSDRFLAEVEEIVVMHPRGELELKGIQRPVPSYRIEALRA